MKIENIIAELKKNEWIDLTHSFGELTPRWPGFNKLSKKIILDFDKYPVRTHLYTFQDSMEHILMLLLMQVKVGGH